jgi:hypothetical protein
VLIDCGLFVGTSGGGERARQIAADVARRTAGHLDVLVLTHEHWDHLSGFIYASEWFQKKIDIAHVWLAWTEDPSDPLARRLAGERDRARAALTSLVEHLQQAGDSGLLRAVRDRVAPVLGFTGFSVDAPATAKSGPRTTRDVLDWARSLRQPSDRYLRPGTAPIRLPALAGVRAYALGPPLDPEMLGRSEPSSSDPQTYGLHGQPPLAADGGFYAAASAAQWDADGGRLHGAEDRPERRPPDQRQALPFPDDSERRLSSIDPEDSTAPLAPRLYAGGSDRWRRIDDDWLRSAERLALKLDNDTNNTSLVLAFELVDSGKVLLFPGDAQVGNWLSWHTHRWRVADGDGRRRTVTAADLLRRTVLYKVGHHASHNATLSKQGLELMESPELVAMIPVDEQFAQSRYGWEMPFHALYDQLVEKSRGRVLRADHEGYELPDVPPEESGLSESQWQAFKDCVSIDDLSIEHAIYD